MDRTGWTGFSSLPLTLECKLSKRKQSLYVALILAQSTTQDSPRPRMLCTRPPEIQGFLSTPRTRSGRPVKTKVSNEAGLGVAGRTLNMACCS